MLSKICLDFANSMIIFGLHIWDLETRKNKGIADIKYLNNLTVLFFIIFIR